MIKNIVLDVGRVLVHWDPIAGMKSLGYDDKTAAAVNGGLVESGLWDLEDEGRYSSEDTLKAFIEAMPEYAKELTDFWNNLDKSIWAFEDSCDWVKRMKAAGYGVYILSNYGEETLKQTRESAMAFLDYVDGAIFSYKYRMIKPHAEIYEKLFEVYNLVPEECVFIDDRAVNIDAAIRAGMQGIVYKDRGQAEEELRRRGVSLDRPCDVIKSRGEVKFVGDGYAGFYSCGLTMQDSYTWRAFREVSSTDVETIYGNPEGVTLKVSHIYDESADATEITTTIINNSDREVNLEMLTSFMIGGIKADRIVRITSFWSAEGRVKEDSINDLNLEMSWNHMAFRVEKFGNVGSMPVRKYYPFVAAVDSESGTYTAVSLYSPASWQMEVTVRHDDTLTLSGGIADGDFGAWRKTLRPGESFTAQKAVAAVGRSLDDVCHKLVSMQKPDISPLDDHMGIAFNEYCTTWGDPTTANMKRIADKLEGKNIQYLVMDSGWYGEDGFKGYWFENEGDWRVNMAKFPGGMKEMTAYIRSRGMIPGIWFEFEVVTPKCDLYYAEEHLVKKDGVVLTIGDRRFLDMEDPWVEEHLTQKVIDFLRDNDFGYIKVDYNDTMGLGVDGPDGPGENLRRKVAATQRFFRKMKAQLPNLVIENCSSGGHRLEASFMELASMASFSDAHEINQLPIIAANMHRIVKPSQTQIWSVLRKEDEDSRIYYSMCATLLGRMGLSGDIYDLSDAQWKLADEGIALYDKVSDIIRDGRTVVNVCNTGSYNNPSGGQLVVRIHEGRGLLVYHRFADSTDLESFVDDNDILRIASVNGADFREMEILQEYGEADRDFSAMAAVFTLQ